MWRLSLHRGGSIQWPPSFPEGVQEKLNTSGMQCRDDGGRRRLSKFPCNCPSVNTQTGPLHGCHTWTLPNGATNTFATFLLYKTNMYIVTFPKKGTPSYADYLLIILLGRRMIDCRHSLFCRKTIYSLLTL